MKVSVPHQLLALDDIVNSFSQYAFIKHYPKGENVGPLIVPYVSGAKASGEFDFREKESIARST